MPQTLLNHLWQSTLFATAAGLLTLALRKNRAPARYWLWLAASCKFLIPFSLLVTIGSHFEWRTAPVAAQLSFFSVVEEIGQPVAPPALLPRVTNAPPAPTREPAVLLCIWLSGLAVVVCAWVRQWRRVRTALRAASPLPLNLPIRAMSSPSRLEPGVFGVFRPVLLLPEGITERLTSKQWEAILAHELCHVRRRDNLTAAIQMAVEAIFWFYPLVWWIGRRLVDERERACDEAVLSVASDPQDYAEGILKVCKLYVESPLVCVSGVTGSNLKKRIRAIMTERVADDLNFAKKLALVVAGVAALAMPIVVGMFNAPPLRAQPAAAPAPKFEVASIRPCEVRPPGGRGGAGGEDPSPGRLNVCRTLEYFINLAYVRFANGDRNPLRLVPILGGPSWINSDHYQINAKAEGNPDSPMMQGPMLQTLLEDRFKLKIHRETKEVPVYALTAAKSGSKLQPFKDGSCISADSAKPPPLPLAPELKLCGGPKIAGEGLTPTLEFNGVSLDELSKFLGSLLGRPVIDKTGISGKVDFRLGFALDESTPGLSLGLPPSDDPPGPSIFTAVQEQLGLKLEPAKGPGEFLIIDHVEKPSEN